MKQQQYLEKLELELRRQNITALDDVLNDYKEHFAVGIANGKSEDDISEKLGDPLTIAKAYLAENLIQKIQDAPVQDQLGFFFKALLRMIILTPVNFLMLVGPVLIVFVIIVVMWSLLISLGGAGIGAAVKIFTLLPLATLGFWGTGAVLLGSLATVSVGLFGMMVLILVTQIIFQIFTRYLQWNIDFVKGRN